MTRKEPSRLDALRDRVIAAIIELLRPAGDRDD